jgi:hypothetical protein
VSVGLTLGSTILTKCLFGLSRVFLGYGKPHVGYKCLHILTGRIYISRHVVFNEGEFPFIFFFFITLVSTPSSNSPCVVHPPTLRLAPSPSIPPPTSSALSSPMSSSLSPSLDVSPSSSTPHVSSHESSSIVSSSSLAPNARTHHMVTCSQNNIH